MNNIQGNIVCSIRNIDPGVPILILDPRRTIWPSIVISFHTEVAGAALGRNVISLLFTLRPSVSAWQARASQSAPAWCAGFIPPAEPGLDFEPRFPLMSVMWMGMDVSELSAKESRKSWPPPSRVVPSIWIGFLIMVAVEEV